MAPKNGKLFVLDGINQDLLRGGDDNDVVRGTRDKPWVWNGRRGVIQLRGGDDLIEGGRFVRLYGETVLGKGRDLVTGRDSITLLAVDQFNGSLSMGAGQDRLVVTDGLLQVGEDSRLTMDDGSDRIEAIGISVLGGWIDAGEGHDRLLLGNGSLSIALGNVTLGAGRDRLIARGGLRLSDGSCRLGSGDDLVDVRGGGLDYWDSPSNLLDLGPGNDRMIGFASAPDQHPSFDSGAGLRGGKGRDTLVLTTGVYQVVGDRISTADSFLPVAGINVLAGINGGSFAYRPGTLTVDETGVATFVADL